MYMYLNCDSHVARHEFEVVVGLECGKGAGASGCDDPFPCRRL